MTRSEEVPLGECCEVVSGGTPKTTEPAFWGGRILWATPKDLSDLESRYISETARTISDAGLRRSGARVLPTQSVLLSSRAPIGLVAINEVPMATNQGFKSLVPDSSKVDATYLAWWLQGQTGRLQAMGSGATFKELSKAVVSRIKVPLPPLVEQKRVAGVLEAADNLRSRRRRAIAALDQLEQSLFDHHLRRFSEETQLTGIGCLCQVRGGKRLPKGASYADVPTEHRYIRVTDFVSGEIDSTGLPHLPSRVQQTISRYTVATGDVIISIAGSVGHVAEVDESASGANLTENAAKLVPLRVAEYDPTYLVSALRSQPAQSQIRALTGQVTIGKLALHRVEKIRVPLPPIHEQRSLAVRLTRARAVLHRQRTHLARLDSLSASLEHRAFAGEL